MISRPTHLAEATATIEARAAEAEAESDRRSPIVRVVAGIITGIETGVIARIGITGAVEIVLRRIAGPHIQLGSHGRLPLVIFRTHIAERLRGVSRGHVY